MNKIIISACLLGERCRYDGGSKPCGDPVLAKWRDEGRLVPICPEVMGGLPTPRLPCQRRGGKVVCESGADFTAEYARGAQLALAAAQKSGAVMCILKEYSPSCGVNEIYDGSFTGAKISGQGVAAQLLSQNGFAVFSEQQLSKAAEYFDKHRSQRG